MSSPQGVVLGPSSLLQFSDPQPEEHDDEDQGVYRKSGQHDRKIRVQQANNTEGWTYIHWFPPIVVSPRLGEPVRFLLDWGNGPEGPGIGRNHQMLKPMTLLPHPMRSVWAPAVEKRHQVFIAIVCHDGNLDGAEQGILGVDVVAGPCQPGKSAIDQLYIPF